MAQPHIYACSLMRYESSPPKNPVSQQLRPPCCVQSEHVAALYLYTALTIVTMHPTGRSTALLNEGFCQEATWNCKPHAAQTFSSRQEKLYLYYLQVQAYKRHMSYLDQSLCWQIMTIGSYCLTMPSCIKSYHLAPASGSNLILCTPNIVLIDFIFHAMMKRDIDWSPRVSVGRACHNLKLTCF